MTWVWISVVFILSCVGALLIGMWPDSPSKEELDIAVCDKLRRSGLTEETIKQLKGKDYYPPL
jgi:hypothetical protein